MRPAPPLCDGWIRVVPGDAAASHLVDKLRAPAACGEVMPVGAPLPEAEIACVEQWISQLPPAECTTCRGPACVDTDSDPAHCGTCDSPYPTGIACNGGSCACPEGTMPCGDDCVDPLANGLQGLPREGSPGRSEAVDCGNASVAER